MSTPEDDEKEEGKKSKPGEKKAWKPKAGSKAEQLAVKKKSQYISADVPDVAKTPSPGGPVPIPYPNIGKSSDTAKGSKKVKIKGKEIKAEDKSFYKKSKGDEAATKSLGQGVVSQKNQGKQHFSTWSTGVKVEGKNVTRKSKFSGSGTSLNDADRIKPMQNKVRVGAAGAPEYLKHPKEDGPKKKEPAEKGKATKDGKKVIEASRKKKLEVPLDTDTLGALTDRMYEKFEREAAQERDVTGSD